MSTPTGADVDAPDIFTAYGSNAFRLTLRQWAIVTLVAALFVALVPRVWRRVETFSTGPDFRMNYELSNDYVLFERAAAQVVATHDTMLIGDSVAWGQYVKREQTLSHDLNELAGSERVANLGVDGMHPMALAGLIEHYGGAIRGKNVILLCNPLWMSSPKHDLQSDEEFRFNHPKLVPQFSPSIPCYKDDVNTRLGNVVERNSSFLGWTSHVQQTYFDKSDIPAWTLEHPYAAPGSSVNFAVPADSNVYRHEPLPWTARGAAAQDFPFVDLNASLQWLAFTRLVDTLSERSNSIHVVIVPLNEHMMTSGSRAKYQSIENDMRTEFKRLGVEYFVPPVLPSAMYADASHPLEAGYRVLAEQVYNAFLKQPPKN